MPCVMALDEPESKPSQSPVATATLRTLPSRDSAFASLSELGTHHPSQSIQQHIARLEAQVAQAQAQATYYKEQLLQQTQTTHAMHASLMEQIAVETVKVRQLTAIVEKQDQLIAALQPSLVLAHCRQELAKLADDKRALEARLTAFLHQELDVDHVALATETTRQTHEKEQQGTLSFAPAAPSDNPPEEERYSVSAFGQRTAFRSDSANSVPLSDSRAAASRELASPNLTGDTEPTTVSRSSYATSTTSTVMTPRESANMGSRVTSMSTFASSRVPSLSLPPFAAPASRTSVSMFPAAPPPPHQPLPPVPPDDEEEEDDDLIDDEEDLDDVVKQGVYWNDPPRSHRSFSPPRNVTYPQVEGTSFSVSTDAIYHKPLTTYPDSRASLQLPDTANTDKKTGFWKGMRKRWGNHR